MGKLEINNNKAYPSKYAFIIIFCIAASFETAFLSLTIQDWSIHNIAIYLVLALTLQIMACLKVVCIWYIHRHMMQSMAYISCAAISSLLTYTVVEAFINLTTVFVPTFSISLNSIFFALIDGLLSMVLLYGVKSQSEMMLKNELLQLASQIRHHFLFNTLNTTVCRIDENPERARVNIEKLACLLRKMLSLNTYISLKEELDSVQCYLEIEKYRLEERLRVSWFLDRNMDVAIKVPAFILQPLVENAIYHGIENILGGGTVTVSLCTVKNRLIIQVRNPIADARYLSLSRHSNRMAQTNIERRLALVYGDDFSFERERCKTEYRVKINIPKEAHND